MADAGSSSVNDDGRENDHVEEARGRALGHIRNATETILGDSSRPAGSVLLGISCLDLQSMFGDIWPAWIPNELTASESLARAEAELVTILDDVPLAIWVALRSLRGQVGDGHR